MFDDFDPVLSWYWFAVIAVIFGVRYWLKGRQFSGRESAKGKVAVVTGANCGVGKQITRILNEKGAKVYMGCRSLEKGQQAVAELAKCGCSLDRLILLPLDLCSFKSIRKFVELICEQESNLDILINNAGVMLYPSFKFTEDNHEITWQTNFLGHFLLTELLLPLLKAASDESRIVNVSALAHYSVGNLDLTKMDQKEFWGSRESYSISKLAQVMHAAHLTLLLRQQGSHVTINACHPGLCYTRLARHTPLGTCGPLATVVAPLAWFLLKTPKDGAQCPVHCALSSSLRGVSGKYVSECQVKQPSEMVADETLCSDLYAYSKKACGL